MEINRVYCEDCRDTMARMPDEYIDLTVTSPPYDNLRTYKNNIDKVWGEHIWKLVIEGLYRVTKKGGVVVWVVGDATIKGSETGTSFRQALYFKEVGFNLHDTMIYTKGGQGATGSNRSYWQDFEYMFIFSKDNLTTFNPIKDRKNKTKPGSKIERSGHRHKTGEVKERRVICRNEFGKRFNVWQYHETGTRNVHPAVFPEQLVNDHIISWSNEGDLIYDPFMGSGTTAKMALLNRRNWIGSEISFEYCELINDRIRFIKKED